MKKNFFFLNNNSPPISILASFRSFLPFDVYNWNKNCGIKHNLEHLFFRLNYSKLENFFFKNSIIIFHYYCPTIKG